jgi:hypothetical protein
MRAANRRTPLPTPSTTPRGSASCANPDGHRTTTTPALPVDRSSCKAAPCADGGALRSPIRLRTMTVCQTARHRGRAPSSNRNADPAHREIIRIGPTPSGAAPRAAKGLRPWRMGARALKIAPAPPVWGAILSRGAAQAAAFSSTNRPTVPAAFAAPIPTCSPWVAAAPSQLRGASAGPGMRGAVEAATLAVCRAMWGRSPPPPAHRPLAAGARRGKPRLVSAHGARRRACATQDRASFNSRADFVATRRYCCTGSRDRALSCHY